MHAILMCLLALSPLVSAATSPHIVFIVADDLGWNDIGFNNPDIISPNLNSLARQGLILSQSYMQPTCTPSRSAFMTGYYPFRTGVQQAYLPLQPACVPTDLTFLPQELKTLGYNTHAIAKWHLGSCNWNCTPTYRGFDSFYGFYNGQEGYYNYDMLQFGGYDFRKNTTVFTDNNGTYSNYVYRDYLNSMIADHNPDTPLFLYMALQAIHTPLEVPKEYTDLYPHIHIPDRRIVAGMVTAMDDVVGNVTSALKARGMYNDTIFIFTSDNGGWAQTNGNNYPLRGGKVSVWEGGTRVPAFVSGRGVPASAARYEGLIHAVDWFPSIVAAAGGTVNDTDIDGVNVWDAITSMQPSPRTEFVYNLDFDVFPVNGRAALRQGDYKLIDGWPGLYSDWYVPDRNYVLYNMQNFLLNAFPNCNSTACPTDLYPTLFKGLPPRPMEGVPYGVDGMRGFDELGSDLAQGFLNLSECHPDAVSRFIEIGRVTRLYNLKDDPEERNNLFCQDPDTYLPRVHRMEQRLNHYSKQHVPQTRNCNDAAAAPSNYNGFWSPGWC